MEKEKRNLSGIYFRHQNKDTGVWENRVFEDLSISDQEELLKDNSFKLVRNILQELKKENFSIF